jgi:hypothetical protein
MRGTWLLFIPLLVPLSGCFDKPAIVDLHPTSVPGELNDHQIVGILAELGLAERQGAEIAGPRVVTPEAQNLTAVLRDQAALSVSTLISSAPVTPAGSDLVDLLIHTQIDAFNVVLAQQGIAIDVAYYCVQLRGQVQALDIIDNQLTPSAMDPTVQMLIQQARAITVLHQQLTLTASMAFHLTADNPLCNPM